jgi:DNA polymerase-3 subunit gamma/tau
MLLKAHEEVRRAPDPKSAFEMVLIRLCFAADLPGPEEALKALALGTASPTRGGSSSPAEPPRPGRAPPPLPHSPASPSTGGASLARAEPNLRPAPALQAQDALRTFQDVVSLIEAKRDVVLKLDVDRFVRLVDFKPGQITFATAEGAPSNLTQRLAGRLKEWTGRPWTLVIEGGGSGAETQYEKEQRDALAFRAQVEAHPTIAALKAAFPGAEIVAVKKRLDPSSGSAGGGESGEDGGEGLQDGGREE